DSARPVVAAGAVLGYLLLLEVLGFAPTTFLFLLLLFRLERRSWMFSAASAAAGAVGSYVLFQLWLKSQLPPGALRFSASTSSGASSTAFRLRSSRSTSSTASSGSSSARWSGFCRDSAPLRRSLSFCPRRSRCLRSPRSSCWPASTTAPCT